MTKFNTQFEFKFLFKNIAGSNALFACISLPANISFFMIAEVSHLLPTVTLSCANEFLFIAPRSPASSVLRADITREVYTFSSSAPLRFVKKA